MNMGHSLFRGSICRSDRHNENLGPISRRISLRISFRNTKFYIAPYGKINHGVVNLSYNCGVKLGLTAICKTVTHTPLIEIIA